MEGLVCQLGRVVVCEKRDLLRKEFLVRRDEALRLKAPARLVVVVRDVGADIEVVIDLVAAKTEMGIVIAIVVASVISIAIACFHRPFCID